MPEDLDVKIVHLEPLRVACVNGYGLEPENLAFEKMGNFFHRHGLDKDGQQHRFFGYNNPGPSAGSPNYGYDVWVTVDETIQNEGEVQVLEFPGGLYAVLRIKPAGGDDIFKAWQRFVAWQEKSRYRMGSHQWLEEHIGGLELHFPDLILDLYMPVAE